VTYDTRITDPWTGEIMGEPHTYMRLVPTHARLSETLTALATDVPEALRKKERADRGKKAEPTPIAEELIPACADHGAGDVDQHQEAVQGARGSVGGIVPAAMTEHGELLLAPEPKISDQGAGATGAPPAWPTYLTHDKSGSGGDAHHDRHVWVQERVERARVR